MIRVSTVVFGLIGCFVALSSAGCRVSVETKNRFVEEGVTQTDTKDWAGEAIVIDAQGVGVSINGGLEVVADASVTKVTASARMLAMAFAEEKANADLSISEAKQTFKITNDGDTIRVECGHGASHGSSNGGESGCEKLVVRVPAGTDQQKLVIKALSGNGSVNLKLGSAVASRIESNGRGDIDAELPATPGGEISIVAEDGDDIVGRLPSDFAADDIQLVADDNKIKNDFSDAKLGQGAGGRGQPGTGLKSLKLASKVSVSETGAVTLTRR